MPDTLRAIKVLLGLFFPVKDKMRINYQTTIAIGYGRVMVPLGWIIFAISLGVSLFVKYVLP